MVKPVRKTNTKNPPIFSHEFIIQNHADIVSCIAMVFVIGLMVQATSPVASIFIALQHNVTEAGEVPLYTSGIKDYAAIFFYSLICIVIHAIIQEYMLDKVSKRMHLSKSKLAILNNSGQLAIFYIASVIWGIDIIFREKYLPNISSIWSDYPAPMSFMVKLFLIIQIAYCLHELPEIYFQRTKKEEYVEKAIHSIASLVAISIPYFLNFNKLLICLVVLHFISEVVIHSARLVQTIDKDDKFTKLSCALTTGVMVVCRAASIMIAFLTLWFGMSTLEGPFDYATGCYNILPVRLGLLAGIFTLQIYLATLVIGDELKRAKESRGGIGFFSFSFFGGSSARAQQKAKAKKPSKMPELKSKKQKRTESDLPEVDQNTHKNLKHRAQKAKAK